MLAFTLPNLKAGSAVAPSDAVFGAKRIASDDLRNADDGDAEVVGEVDHAFLLEHDDVASGEGDASAASGGELLDRGGTDGRDVAATVVTDAGAFAEGPAAGAAETCDALDHLVGTFDGFDGDDVTLADGEGLADVEAEQVVHHAPGELDVGLLLGGGLGAGHHADVGHLIGDRDGRVEQGDAELMELIGNGAQHTVRAFVVAEVLEPHPSGAEVGQVAHEPPGVVHQLGLIDPADHDGVADAPALEGAAPGTEAEDAHFGEGLAELGELGVVLVREAEAVDLVAHVTEALGDHDGKEAAAGDETDARGRGRRVGQDGQGAGGESEGHRRRGRVDTSTRSPTPRESGCGSRWR
jgi:hypothetical protein